MTAHCACRNPNIKWNDQIMGNATYFKAIHHYNNFIFDHAIDEFTTSGKATIRGVTTAPWTQQAADLRRSCTGWKYASLSSGDSSTAEGKKIENRLGKRKQEGGEKKDQSDTLKDRPPQCSRSHRHVLAFPPVKTGCLFSRFPIHPSVRLSPQINEKIWINKLARQYMFRQCQLLPAK